MVYFKNLRASVESASICVKKDICLGCGYVAKVNVVFREERPPKGEEPIEWILLTTLSIATLIVAWRTLYICRLGRRCPDLDCDLIFDPAEWQSVWNVFLRGDTKRDKPIVSEQVYTPRKPGIQPY